MDTKRRRPWTVFVWEIGPTYTFASSERAFERARKLVSGTGLDNYGTVLVWESAAHGGDFYVRWRFTPDIPEGVRERFHLGEHGITWVREDASDNKEQAQ